MTQAAVRAVRATAAAVLPRALLLALLLPWPGGCAGTDDAPAPTPDTLVAPDTGAPADGGGPADAGPDSVGARDAAGPDGGPVAADADATGPDAVDVVPDVAPPCTSAADCDDDDPCTEDRCAPDGCTHERLPADECCASDADCDDGVACTLDSCALHRCFHDRESNRCCLDRRDCDDGEPCTDDRCVANTCANVLVSGGACRCETRLDCEDGLACTAAVCEDGACLVTLAAVEDGDCCEGDADCDDGEPETADRCVLSTCEHALPRPCRAAADCEDGDPCTTDTCPGADGAPRGTCAWEARADCCHIDAQCDDGVPLTADRCLSGDCAHVPPGAPDCAADADCADGNDCTRERCVAGQCSLEPLTGPGCCRIAADCEDGDPCTAHTCEAFGCAQSPVTGPADQVAWRFGPADPAFTVEDDGSGARWQVSPRSFISAPSSLYFGVSPEEPTIDVGRAVSGTAQSPAVALPADRPATLAAWVYVDVEPLLSRDVFELHVVSGAGSTRVWSKDDLGGSTVNAWVAITADLAAWAGEEVRLSLRFDSIDATNNDYEGIYVDDLALRWECAP